jgi:hypothetical protein
MGQAPVTAKTPVYELEYIVQGEPLRGARLALENNAKTIEAALVRGGIAPPAAQDLATLAGRVTATEATNTTQDGRLAALEAWRPRATDVLFSQGGLNSAWAPTAMTWTSGLGAKLTQAADGVTRKWSAVAMCNVSGAGKWHIRCDLAAGGGKAASTLYWPNAGGFVATIPAGSELTQGIQGGGTLLGDQAATFYLECLSNAAGGSSWQIPTLTITLHAD